MSAAIKINAAHLANITAKLDELDLSVDEKGLLCAVFQAAGVNIHGDVSGFGLAGAVGLGNSFGALFGVANRGGSGATVNAVGSSVGAVVGPTGSTAVLTVPGVGDATFVICQ